MNWAEEKTLEQFIEANSYDPSKASVIGLFPRNMVLKEQTVTNLGLFTVSGHGFIFELTATASMTKANHASGSDVGYARTRASVNLNGEGKTVKVTYILMDGGRKQLKLKSQTFEERRNVA